MGTTRGHNRKLMNIIVVMYGITSLNERSVVGTVWHCKEWMHHQSIHPKTTWRKGDEERWTSSRTNNWSSSPISARPVTEENGDELLCAEPLTRCSAPAELPGELPGELYLYGAMMAEGRLEIHCGYKYFGRVCLFCRVSKISLARQRCSRLSCDVAWSIWFHASN